MSQFQAPPPGNPRGFAPSFGLVPGFVPSELPGVAWRSGLLSNILSTKLSVDATMIHCSSPVQKPVSKRGEYFNMIKYGTFILSLESIRSVARGGSGGFDRTP